MRFLARIARNETAQAAAILALMLLAFFWTPISRYSECYLSAADLLQDFSLVRVDPAHVPGNALLSDSVTEMKPWRMFNRDELSDGRFPLWNPLNGTGCPHFANYQSAVLSPFGLPYYLFDVKTALIAVSFLKLFALGFLTYLYLRQIRLAHAAALVGATAFMFSGHNVLLLTFPHVGALVVVPGGFLFVERAVQKHVAGLRYGWELVGLALVILGGALAGNPEPFYFGMLLTGAYSLARLAGTWIESRREPRALRRLLPLAGSLLACPVLALGLASVQILPFLEYLANSTVFDQRSHVQTPLNPRFWPLEMFPNILGNPASPYVLSYEIPPPNFELVNTAHISGFVSFLALAAVLLAWRNRYARFFWIAGAAWACYAYDLCGLSRVFLSVPTLDLAPMNRSQGLWLFCLACLAALLVDALLRRRETRDWRLALLLVLAALLFLIVHRIGAQRLIDQYAAVPSPNHDKFEAYVPERIATVVRWFALGALLAGALLLLVRRRRRELAALGFLPIVFFPTGWHWRNYEPVCEERFFYPDTPQLDQLRECVGEERVAILGEDSLPPMSNLAWRINLLSNYDGMWVRDFDTLYRALFGESNNWRPILKASSRALQLMGTRWVLAKWDWNFVDSGLSELPRGREVLLQRREILPGRELVQGFRCHQANLQEVMVRLGTWPAAPEGRLRFKLRDLDSGELVSEQSLGFAEVRSSVYTGGHRSFPLERTTRPLSRPVVFRFPARPDSLGHQYRFTLSVDSGRETESVYAFSYTKRAYAEGLTFAGKQALPGELDFDFSCAADRFERVRDIGDYVLYRYRDALPMFQVVGGALEAQDDKQCLNLLRAPLFDPARLVVLHEAPPGEGAAARGRAVAKDAGRLIKRRGSVRIYYVLDDGRSMVWIQDEATFLVNRFRWEDVESVSETEFERFVEVPYEPELVRNLGLRPVVPAENAAAAPRILESQPTRYRLRVECSNPSWLVISQARYPGWVARVNGVETQLVRANFAFSALPLCAGDALVEFEYRPASLRLGLALSAASVLVGLLLLLRLARAQRFPSAAG